MEKANRFIERVIDHWGIFTFVKTFTFTINMHYKNNFKVLSNFYALNVERKIIESIKPTLMYSTPKLSSYRNHRLICFKSINWLLHDRTFGV